MQLTKPTKKSDIVRSWHLYDVKDKILGRVVTDITTCLSGKRKPYYVKYLDCGDYVVVINAKHVKVSGKKTDDKMYARYSGYPGGLKKDSFKNLLANKPERIIHHAVSGMLPANKIKNLLLKRLYIFPEAEHPYKDKFK